MSRSPVRTRSWSSATTTRMVTAAPPGAGWPGRPIRPAGRGPRSTPAEQRGALDHAGDAEPRPVRRRGRRGVAVVVHLQPHAGLVAVDVHGDQRRVPGVAQGVGDGLLGDPVERRVHRRGKVIEVPDSATLDGGPVVLAAPSRSISPSPGWGAKSAGAWLRSTRTIVRISARVRDASSSITLNALSADDGSGRRSARPACAWMAIAETWCATVSCSSRASWTRSSVFTCSSWRSRAPCCERTATPIAIEVRSTARPPIASPTPVQLTTSEMEAGTRMIASPPAPPVRTPIGTGSRAAAGNRSWSTCPSRGRPPRSARCRPRRARRRRPPPR